MWYVAGVTVGQCVSNLGHNIFAMCVFDGEGLNLSWGHSWFVQFAICGRTVGQACKSLYGSQRLHNRKWEPKQQGSGDCCITGNKKSRQKGGRKGVLLFCFLIPFARTLFTHRLVSFITRVEHFSTRNTNSDTFCRCLRTRRHFGSSLLTAICVWMQINEKADSPCTTVNVFHLLNASILSRIFLVCILFPFSFMSFSWGVQHIDTVCIFLWHLKLNGGTCVGVCQCEWVVYYLTHTHGILKRLNKYLTLCNRKFCIHQVLD